MNKPKHHGWQKKKLTQIEERCHQNQLARDRCKMVTAITTGFKFID
jgi:hypothetical protein